MRVPCDNGSIKLGFVAFNDSATNPLILRQFKKASNFIRKMWKKLSCSKKELQLIGTLNGGQCFR